VHDENTAALLLRTAEKIVEGNGLSALSLRRLADAAGVSTRAVYSLFGSKDALVAALGSRAFDWLGEQIAALPVTDDPISDVVDAGAIAFRALVVEHPVLFQIGVQLSWPDPIWEGMTASSEAAWQQLIVRMDRLAARDLLGGRSSEDAGVEFHALCEGLGSMESRGLLTRMTSAQPAAVWRSSLRALVIGLASRPADGPRSARRSGPSGRTGRARRRSPSRLGSD
jgi:AcrR family transcriptional regulator